MTGTGTELCSRPVCFFPMGKQTEQRACLDEALEPDSQYSDAELLQCLDDPTDWFIVDEVGHVLTVAISLRDALRRVRMMMSGGLMPHLLVRDSGRPAVIRVRQLWRMYARVVE